MYGSLNHDLRRRTRSLVLGIVTLLSSSMVARASAEDCAEANYREAIRVFRALYPEMAGKGIKLDFDSHPSLDSDEFPLVFDIGISDLRPLPPAEDRPSPADTVGHLGSHFQFDATDHRINLLFASGSFVESEKLEILKRLVDEHPEWSNAQISEALLSAGAKFGPAEKDRVLAGFPTGKLEPILGKVSIISTEFTFRGNREPPHFAIMQWTLHFRAKLGRHHDEYFVSIEPLGGKIVSLGRRRVN